MKFQKLTLPLVLLAAESASAFPTAEYLTKLIENSDQIVEKRCPFADIKDDIEKTVLKRSVLDTLASPIEGLSFDFILRFIFRPDFFD
jgi:hypothetical protein